MTPLTWHQFVALAPFDVQVLTAARYRSDVTALALQRADDDHLTLVMLGPTAPVQTPDQLASLVAWTSAFQPGDRIELHPATDLWMQGARYGTIVSITGDHARVSVDRLHRTKRIALRNLLRLP